MSEDTSTAVVLAAEDRRAVADALRIATRGKDRPALRSVIVADGLALVTDTYVAVNIPALAGLPAGAWSADALALAVKGAGTDGVRIAPVDGDTLRVDRIAGAYARSRSPERIRQDYADGVPAEHTAGTYYVGSVDGAPGTIAGIYTDAVAAVTADDYVPLVAGFSPDRLADVFGARPSGRRPGQAGPVRILPRGDRAAVVMDGGKPFAVVMPMRGA